MSHGPNTVISKNRELWRLQAGRCYLCLKGLPEGHGHPAGKAATIDHVNPRSWGYGRRRNKLLACLRCNMKKGSRPPSPCELLYLDAINTLKDWIHDERDRARYLQGLSVVRSRARQEQRIREMQRVLAPDIAGVGPG